MSPNVPSAAHAERESDQGVRQLYESLLSAWNEQDAGGMAALFADNGLAIGFDGTTMVGPEQIEAALAGVFRDHRTARYVHRIRDVRWLARDVALLSAVVGMVPPGSSDINPDLNAIQSLVAASTGGGWRIALHQNTPAAFHGRAGERDALSDELRAELTARG